MALSPDQQTTADQQGAYAFEEARADGAALEDGRVEDAKFYAVEAYGLALEGDARFDTAAPELLRQYLRAYVKAKFGVPGALEASQRLWEGMKRKVRQSARVAAATP